ncbi:HK97 family phage prohead protease [Mesorhizobium sp. AaZ16]|uniref:HK97 family phage prohead protease n=1 Tax=Mesorhizobium sp. AaZ16 TaxID=3402289 RepID=UPI00374F85FE
MRISGYGTLFGVCTNQTHIIGAGAFSNLIRDGWHPQMLLGHEGEECGKWIKIEEDDHGLFVVGDIDETTERGRLAVRMVADGDVGALSLGPKRAVQKPIAPGVSYIPVVLDLTELSLVTIPGCPGALIQCFA